MIPIFFCQLSGKNLELNYKKPIESYLEQKKNQVTNEQEKEIIQKALIRLNQKCSQDKLFAHPYYWAGFVFY